MRAGRRTRECRDAGAHKAARHLRFFMHFFFDRTTRSARARERLQKKGEIPKDGAGRDTGMPPSAIEAHYDQCSRYINAMRHPERFTPDELRALTAQQRLSEGIFQASLSGRKNVAYPKLCAERAAARGAATASAHPTRENADTKAVAAPEMPPASPREEPTPRANRRRAPRGGGRAQARPPPRDGTFPRR